MTRGPRRTGDRSATRSMARTTGHTVTIKVFNRGAAVRVTGGRARPPTRPSAPAR